MTENGIMRLEKTQGTSTDYVKSIGTGSKLAAYFLRWVPKQQQQQM